MYEPHLSTVRPGINSFVWRRANGPLDAMFSLNVDSAREVHLILPDRPGVVFGSTTPAESFSRSLLTSKGYQTVRRTSGGGAVLVTPTDQVWLNVYLRHEDPLVDSDIAHSFLWLGELLAGVVSRLVGASERVEIVRERVPGGELSRVICFAGLGFGEVCVGGKKVIGLAQRRTRTQVTYHVAVLISNLQSQLIELLDNPPKVDGTISAAGLSCWGVTRSQLEDALYAEFH